ncbi:universal stress protein [Geoglobus acetivorans]|uniref:Universal stress protein n=1 Tax=Geoglobus acetivorans TaxID=565033 RepID=A0ABZ3H540_GEOAI|nr:universal stress protein [Geoglobus acetivorans]
MIKRVLFPTDFSKASEEGICVFEDLKSVGLEEVIITHVIDLNRLIGPVSGIDIPAVIHDYEEESNQNLRKFAELIEKTGVKAIIDDIRMGEPSSTICDVAEEKGVDAVVIPSHGKSLLAGVLLGSVSEGVVRRSKKPVLVVKLTAQNNGDIRKEFDRLFSRILFAYDFSEQSDRLKDYVKIFAEKGGSDEVMIVHVIEKGEELSDDQIEKLESIKREFEDAGVSSDLFIESGTPYKEIARLVDEKLASLVAISSTGKGLIKSLLGGTADNVVRRSKVPVFVYKQ